MIPKANLHILNIFILIGLLSCNQITKNQTTEIPAFISNIEIDNTIEGEHIYLQKFENGYSLPSELSFLNDKLDSNWIIGQSINKDYQNNSKQHLFEFEINSENKILISDQTHFQENQSVVFWKKNALHQSNTICLNNISTRLKNLSLMQSEVVFDSASNQFVCLLTSCDNERPESFRIISKNLKDWVLHDSLNPFLSQFNFRHKHWVYTGGNHKLEPFWTSIIYFEKHFYIFGFADNPKNQGRIGWIKMKNLLSDQFEIIENPVINPQISEHLLCNETFYPQVIEKNDTFHMFYTAKDDQNDQKIHRAISVDLKKWTTIQTNIISQNEGWNSNKNQLIVGNVAYSNNGFQLYILGSKNFTNHTTQGNLLDGCIGIYNSKSTYGMFQPQLANPIFCGNPLDEKENDHLGGQIQFLSFNDKTYIIYHAKGIDGKYKFLLSPLNSR